tara:strand:+ start:804 stop:1025 length:222 start_codon:yes stop_codon:yes gene_type:complete
MSKAKELLENINEADIDFVAVKNQVNKVLDEMGKLNKLVRKSKNKEFNRRIGIILDNLVGFENFVGKESPRLL